MTRRLDAIQRANAHYVEEMYARFREDPGSVPEDWALFFAGFDLGGAPPAATMRGPSAPPPQEAADHVGGVYGLVLAYREFGHLIADLDPLGDSPRAHPLLELSHFGLSESDLDRVVDPMPFTGPFSGTLRELIAALRETYCGTLGVEFMDISDKHRRDWLETHMEANRNRPVLADEDRVRILEQMLAADAFEQFLHVRYVGQKRFSLEGGTTLIPMLDALVESSAEMGVEQLVIGMPHRGRLNVLAHLLGKPLEVLFGEFETTFRAEGLGGHGDVKYHLGYSDLHTTRTGRKVHLDLNYNPSHLEFVNPVVLGAIRARQTFMHDHERLGGIPVLVHGDASFAGEGIVPETLMLAQLPAYQTGGTVHVIVNNQIGFTTSPESCRATRYATDIARAIESPVLHVNGDDPEAAVHAVGLALAYRETFHRDVIVDLVCYRRHGHNELDDPTFTQPVMYRKIAGHVPAARRYAERLVREGVLDAARLESIEAAIAARLKEAHGRVQASAPAPAPKATLGGAWQGLTWAGEDWSAATAVPRETLEKIVRRAAETPAGFTPHPKLGRLLAERVKMFEEDRIDWATGEMLAIGSLLLEGKHVRMSGQDTGRGTFSQRHAVLHDHEDGRLHVPLQHLAPVQGRFEIIDSMLSESAVLGFEYGYSTADPHTLVLWEAQFGDFANVAQVYVDQFIASAESKWRRMSGLTLLLPHGYEGQGPEHSSGRLERFLELCANGNMQVCNLTTPAQYFHALRRQLHRDFRKPLVIMSPKSLLRHKLAVSGVAEFASETFHTVLDDTRVDDPLAVKRVLLTSGKFYFTLLEALAERDDGETALVRVEQLYPFPRLEMLELFRRYASARDVRWVQEEPANMGAWRHIRHRLEGVLPEGATLERIARKASPTPATGWYAMHAEQERSLIERALGSAVARPATAGARAARRTP